MARLIVWGVGATVAEVLAVVAVVHTLLHRAMLERGLPAWRLSDTLLTSPLLWLGATLVAGGLTRLVAVAALRAGPVAAGADAGGVAAPALAAAVGAVAAWLGLRAVGKLY
jgi:hypothetical protein